ncbi:TIM barrel protein [Streptomyces sp. NPDC097610]|uniref:sugar phosphate isomerase/epimerase family protein n=1 Tax=Streptomyces sp. NPDC097610 TaxID=3157227 RepID=UPI003322A038
MRELSLAALSLIQDRPTDAVRAADAAGFSSVGLRLAAIPASGVDNDLLDNAANRRHLRQVMDDSGVRLLDAEVFRFSPADGVPTPQEATLAAACELGARFVGVISYEPDLGRAADLLGQLAEQAQDYGLSCLIEFMGFSAIKTLTDAHTVVDQSGAANAHILVDTLHVARKGTSVDELRGLDPRHFPMAQICDAASGGVEHDPVRARAEAVSARLDPGTGVLPITDVIRALPAAVPLSVEVPRPIGRDAYEHARSLYAAAQATLTQL